MTWSTHVEGTNQYSQTQYFRKTIGLIMYPKKMVLTNIVTVHDGMNSDFVGAKDTKKVKS